MPAACTSGISLTESPAEREAIMRDFQDPRGKTRVFILIYASESIQDVVGLDGLVVRLVLNIRA